ncbi:MAG: NADH-quinone oxidoreductase subunit J [Phycisphaeraceae bacterium]
MPILAQQTAAEPLAQVAPYLFFAFAGVVCLSAWALVFSQNIVRMAVYLLLTLGGVAGLYFMLNAEFLAAIQLIVYVGGTLILIVFGVMLTSKNPFLQLRVKGWEVLLGVGVGLAIMGLLVFALISTDLSRRSRLVAGGYEHVALIGKALLSAYLVPFEVAAVLLLVVMIGAAFMARKRARQ